MLALPESRSIARPWRSLVLVSSISATISSTVEEVVAEMLLTTTSERQGRAIDKDAGAGSMEKKKQEGYF